MLRIYFICKHCGESFKPNNAQRKNYDYRCSACRYKIWQKSLTKEYYTKKPWWRHLKSLRARCNNPNAAGYEYYGAKGRKALITADEIKRIWYRDKGWRLKQPTIDRINNNGDYVFTNCRFIEMAENQLNRDFPKGEAAHNVKYTTNQVKQVLYLLSCGIPQVDIAKKTGVNKMTVCAIKTRRQWRHVNV